MPHRTLVLIAMAAAMYTIPEADGHPGSVSPPFTTPGSSPAFVSASIDPGGRITSILDVERPTMTCSIQIIQYTDTFDNYAFYNRYYIQHDNSGTSCFGVSPPVCNNELPCLETFFESVKSALPALHVPATGREQMNQATGDGRSSCVATLYINNPGGNNRNLRLSQYVGAGECRTRPVATSCTITVLSDILHPQQPSGDISSTAETQAIVQCSAPASVGMSVRGATVPLNGTAGVIRSDLYVDRIGQSTTRINAHPVGTVKLISRIDSAEATAGAYSGADVLTASWD